MNWRRITLFVGLASILAFGGCMTPLDREPIGLAEVVPHDEGVNNLYRDGKYYFAGQPNEEWLGHLSEEGVVNVINLRTEKEVLGLEFNEPAVTRGLGMAYFSSPITYDSFSASDVDRFADLLAEMRDPTLIHCGSSNRVGMLWGAYLVRERGMTLTEAEIRGRAAGMYSDTAVEAMRRVAMEGK